MLRSMTGFGAGSVEMDSGNLTVEIRSVNGKFCEVRARLPRELASHEALLVRRIKERLARGNVDVAVKWDAGPGGAAVPVINETLAQRFTESLRKMKDRLGLAGDVTLADLLAVEGIVSQHEAGIDGERAGEALLAAVDQALSGLIAMREKEGASLAEDLRRRMEHLASLESRLRELAPAGLALRQQRLEERIAEILGEVPLDPQRIAQEVAILAERSDVAEELTRMASHLDQFAALMESEEPAGRKMDFLVQEMNREVNTIASKASWLSSVEIVVEMKAEIERIREQIQNIE